MVGAQTKTDYLTGVRRITLEGELVLMAINIANQ